MGCPSAATAPPTATADAGDELGSPSRSSSNMETVFKSDKCDPKECDNWTCKSWCKCFKAHPEIIEIFEGPNPSAIEQDIRAKCPADNDECDCTEYHFGNAKKEVARSVIPLKGPCAMICKMGWDCESAALSPGEGEYCHANCDSQALKACRN